MNSTVIYTRRSSGTDDDSTSLETQEADSRALAKQLGWVVTNVYKEGVKSGVNISGRPVMQQLLADIEAGRVENVIAFKWSRMSRDALEGMEILSRSKRSGVSWRFVHGDIPVGVEGTPAAVLFQAFAGSGAEGERASIKIQTDRGYEERIARGGRRSGRKPPYGWKSPDLGPGPDKKRRPGWTLEQKDEEAKVVEKIYRRLVSGESLAKITAWLQDSDYKTPTGLLPHYWSDVTVKNIIRHPVNYGRLVTDRYQQVPGTSSSRERPEDDWRDIPNAEPLVPIVDEGTWRAAVAGLAENRKRSGGKKNPDNHGLLSYGVAVCACTDHTPKNLRWHMDKRGRYKTDQKTHRTHGCPFVSVSSQPLDEEVWQEVLRVIRTPDAIASELKNQVEGDTAKDELKEATAKVHKLRRNVENLTDSIADTDSNASRKTLLARLDEFNVELEQAELFCQSVAARAAQVTDWNNSVDRWVAELYGKAEEIDNYTLAQKREVLQKLQAKVYIGKKTEGQRWRLEIGMAPPPEVYDGMYLGVGGWDDIDPANEWPDPTEEELVEDERLFDKLRDLEDLDKNIRSVDTSSDESGASTRGADSKRSVT